MTEHLLDKLESLHDLGHWIKKSDVEELLKDCVPKSAIDERIEELKRWRWSGTLILELQKLRDSNG